MRRFFVDPRSITADTAHLSKTESQHIVSVLRLQPGEAVELFDGKGKVYHGKLQEISRNQVTVRLLSIQSENHEKSPPVFLLQSLLKGKKMDFLVQKTTELGVHAFQPLLTRYSENRGNHVRQNERWQRIMLEACKQCKRTVPMLINPLVKFNEIDSSPFSTKLLLWEDEKKQPLDPQQFVSNQPVCLLIGPEGGFHEDEIDHARENGFQTVTLGSRILRAETATLATVAIVQYLLGTLGK